MKCIYKCIDDQIKILKQDKNVVFLNHDVEEEFKKFLKLNNYTNVISPYKIYFVDSRIDGKHIYGNKINIDEYKKLYEEDVVDSFELLRIAFRFETAFRSILAYHLSSKLSDEPDYFENAVEASVKFASENKKISYCVNKDNYFDSSIKDKNKLLKLQMSNVEYEKVNRAYEITEFKDRVAEKYNIIDVSESKWFLNINFISFEDLHFLFKILDRPIQNSIIFDLTGKSLSVEHFNTNIRNVKKLRNKLAHIENLTIIVNKQLITESHEYIVKGKRVFTTIKFIYETIEERINTKLTNKLEKNYEIRVEKYKNIGLYT